MPSSENSIAFWIKFNSFHYEARRRKIIQINHESKGRQKEFNKLSFYYWACLRT